MSFRIQGLPAERFAHLYKMSDQELIDFGRALGRVPKRVSGVPDTFNRLTEARAEWRRRHLKVQAKGERYCSER